MLVDRKDAIKYTKTYTDPIDGYVDVVFDYGEYMRDKWKKWRSETQLDEMIFKAMDRVDDA